MIDGKNEIWKCTQRYFVKCFDGNMYLTDNLMRIVILDIGELPLFDIGDGGTSFCLAMEKENDCLEFISLPDDQLRYILPLREYAIDIRAYLNDKSSSEKDVEACKKYIEEETRQFWEKIGAAMNFLFAKHNLNRKALEILYVVRYLGDYPYSFAYNILIRHKYAIFDEGKTNVL